MRATVSKLRFAASVSALSLAAVALPGAADAATCTWGGGTDLWTNVLKWSCGAQPTSADNVFISAGGSIVNVNNITANVSTLSLAATTTLNIGNSNFYVYGGSVVNNGTINLFNASQFLSGSGTVSFTGTGVIAFDNTNNFANLNGNGQVFSFGSGQTLRGSGGIGVNNTYISNAGLISADAGAGTTLAIDALGGNGGNSGSGLGASGNASLYNTGTMRATGGSTLAIGGGRYENSATGVIQALNGSIVSLNGDSRIVGGTLTTAGTGVVQAFSASQYLQDVTLSSGSKIDQNNDNLYLNNSFINNGTLTIRNASQLINELGGGGALTISGTGNIVLDNSLSYAQINGNGGRIVFGSSQSIQGSGQVGINNTFIVTNGVFSANSGSGIAIDALGGNGGNAFSSLGAGGNASLVNNNIIEATGGSTLSFEGGWYENATGAVIRAVNNSTVSLNGDARIVGGTLTSDATSLIRAYTASQYLQNVTLSAGSRIDQNNDNLYLNNSFTNNGTLTIRNASQLFNEQGAGGALTITGTGAIVLDNSTGYAYINGNGGRIVFGSNQSIQGSGDVGVNNTYIVNNNVFSANSGSGISLDAGGGNGGNINSGLGAGGNASLLNNNIIEATGGSALGIQGGWYENAAGAVIRAVNNSTVSLNGDSRIVGGTLTSDATSVIKAYTASQYLQNVTLSAGSRIDQNNDNLYLNTSFINNGTLTIRNASQLFNEQGAGGALTITGTGAIVLDNSQSYAYINGNGGQITFGSNANIQGSGDVGVNNTYILNNNILSFSGAGGILLDAGGGNGGNINSGLGTGGNASLLNNSVIEATGGKTLSFQGGRYENATGAVIRALGGSTINLNGDSRIVGGTLTSDGTSSFVAQTASQYLQNVTLSAGSRIDQNNDNLYLNTSFINNGTLTVRNASQLFNELGSGGALTIGGTGIIVLDNSASYAQINGNGGQDIFGSGLTIRGRGQVGINNTVITNNGLISADAGTGTGISVDATGGNGGTGGGVGTGSISSLLNSGTIQAANGSTLWFEGGRYENTATGTLGATGAGSQFVMNGDANLINLQAGGVLNLGNYFSSTTGAASVLNLRGTGASTVSTIGTGAVGTDTVVTLSGANSVINITDFSSGANTSIDNTLTNVAKSGRLEVLAGRNITIVAGGGAFGNAGIVQLGGGTFAASGYTNSGTTTGFGTIAAAIANTGTVEAAGGLLSTGTITGPTGTMRSLTGATLSIAGATGNSTAGLLINNGALALGANNVTVTSDYQNANFGSGNAFNRRNNVTGSGLILANSATMDLSGPAISGNTLNVGNVRTGGSSSTTLTITNNGTTTTLRGAVQNSSAPSVALSNPDFVLTPGGGSATVTISYTGLAAGSLSGQTLNVVNNFDNVAAQTIGLAGNIYQVAQAGAQPATLVLGARRVGDAGATATITIANTAPVTPGFNEALRADLSANSGFLLNSAGTATVNNLAAGNSTPVTLSRGTGTAGAFSGTVTIANTSLAVAGSGLQNLALAGQTIAVSNNVYAAAIANVSGSTVNFGTVRRGAANPTGSVGIANGASGALTDVLVTSIGSTPANVSAGAAPGPLAAGQSGNVAFSLNTATAGQVSGSTQLNFISRDAELADLALASQTVKFAGTVTDVAVAGLFKNAGAGIFSGSGTNYTYDLGTLLANSGTFTSDFGVANLVALSSFSEALGGSFGQTAGTGYTFSGNIFSGLQGGSSNTGNFLSFDTTGLSNGTYGQTVTFNGYSSYPGLSNQTLSPITVTITAQVTGGGGNPGAVPEPATWAMMIIGFGFIGGTMRRTTNRRRSETAA